MNDVKRDRTGLLIDGEWASSEDTFKSFNPSTGEPIGIVDNAGKKHVEEAVAAANSSLAEWCKKTVDERAEIVGKVVDLLYEKYGEEGEQTELKKLIQKEVGRRFIESDIEVIETADMLSYYVEKTPEVLSSETLDLNQELWPTKESRVVHEPVGVVGVIKPWNYPLELPIWSIGAALMTGNTVVFKPSENSSFVGAELGKIFQEAEIPDGVINVITGDGSTGEALVESDGVDMVSFTGSQKIGKEIAKKCGEDLKEYSLELGGNDPAIIAPDVDLELAANGIVWGSYCNTGQVCVRPKRVFVHDKIYDNFTEKVLSKTQNLKKDKDFGPLINQKQLNTVKDQVSQTIDQGATLLYGGSEIDDTEGYYFEPTILEDVTPDMTVFKNECFGPVMPIIRVDSVEEGIELSNSSDYGLGASIWTGDTEAGSDLAEEFNAGMVWVNDVNVAFPQAPWGGIKGSGSGVELSKWGIEEYTNIKHINVETSEETDRDWWFPYGEN